MSSNLDAKWRHPWQVVRLFPNRSLIVCCSHRWEWQAYWCASWRQATKRRRSVGYDLRETPEVARG